MITILSSFISVFLTVPLFGFIVLFLLFKVITRNTRKSVHMALDYTTILFIVAVHFLIVTIWGKSLLWLIFVIMIFFAMVFSIVHWKIKGEIDFSKVLKGFWRFNFLFFFIVYITLTIFGMIERVVNYTFAG